MLDNFLFSKGSSLDVLVRAILRLYFPCAGCARLCPGLRSLGCG